MPWDDDKFKTKNCKPIKVWQPRGQKRLLNVCSDKICTNNQSDLNNKLFLNKKRNSPRVTQYDKTVY